jgi:Ca-activated chloride channel homolog
MTLRGLWIGAVLTALAISLSACGQSVPKKFEIVSGSENKILEPIVAEFCRSKNVDCAFAYKGSLDIGFLIRSGAVPFDAVWPASSLWIDMYDAGRKVKHVQSIAQMPVILGVRITKARELGWVGKPVTMADILAAVTAGNLRYLMTSATQSNSGAAAYLAMLSTALGDAQMLQKKDLENPAVRDKVKTLLRAVERSAGSSSWLADLYTDNARTGHAYDAMWNYEAVLKETNDTLAKDGKELLYAVYPADGVAIADSPLGFVDRGTGPEMEKFFLELQAFLLAKDAAQKIASTGRRVPLSDVKGTPEPAWNFDPGRRVTAIRAPEREVIERALNVYQESLRRPSLTAMCLDFSGSMAEKGEPELKRAVKALLTPAEAAEQLIQWTPADQIVVAPFNDHVEAVYEGSGKPEDQAKLLSSVFRHFADGGTDMYSCAAEALRRMAPRRASGDYLPAIIIMTDGKTEGSASDFETAWRSAGSSIPVFGVTFGNADVSQLNALAKLTGGRVFDGDKDLTGAFRATRGYN